MKYPKYIPHAEAQIMRSRGLEIPAGLTDPTDREYNEHGGEKFLLSLELRTMDDDRVFAQEIHISSRPPFNGIAAHALDVGAQLLRDTGKFCTGLALMRILCNAGFAWTRAFVPGEP